MNLSWWESASGLLFGIAVIGLLVFFQQGCTAEEKPTQKRAAPSARQELLRFSAHTAPEYVTWAKHRWPAVVAACPGLSRYASDLLPGSIEGYHLTDHGDGAGPRVVPVIKVSNKPIASKLWEYHAPGNNCYFEILHPVGDTVIISKSACQSLCLDRAVPFGEFPEGLKLSLR